MRPWPRKHNAANVRIGVDRVAQAQAQVEAGPLPRQPSEFAAEDFARESFAVARRRDRDDRIGMDMIDVRERQERMKRSIDAGGARAAGKGAIVEVWNELVFVLAPAKAAFQCDEFVLIQLREAGQIHRAQIVAGSFHPQNRHARVVERIDVAQVLPRCCRRRNWSRRDRRPTNASDTKAARAPKALSRRHRSIGRLSREDRNTATWFFN